MYSNTKTYFVKTKEYLNNFLKRKYFSSSLSKVISAGSTQFFVRTLYFLPCALVCVYCVFVKERGSDTEVG